MSPELEKEMQEQTQKRLDLYQTTSSELQGLIKNHIALKNEIKETSDTRKQKRKEELNIAPETDPLYITLFCNKTSSSATVQAAAPSESESGSEEAAESDSLKFESFNSEQPEPAPAPLSGGRTYLRHYTPLASSPLFKAEQVDTARFTRSKGKLVIDNLPHGVVNNIVLSKALGGVTLKSCKIFKYPISPAEANRPKQKAGKKAKSSNSFLQCYILTLFIH